MIIKFLDMNVNLFWGDCMDDYIAVLLNYLTEHSPSADWEYLARQARQSQAAEELRNTLSPEQRRLFLRYEEAHNALASVSEEIFARQAFLLAREIFR